MGVDSDVELVGGELVFPTLGVVVVLYPDPESARSAPHGEPGGWARNFPGPQPSYVLHWIPVQGQCRDPTKQTRNLFFGARKNSKTPKTQVKQQQQL